MAIRHTVISILFGALAACGGGGTGNDHQQGTPDGPVVHIPDAAVDGSTSSLMGLGQKCVPAMQGADCPSDANGCLSFAGATSGFCTKLCVNTSTFMTDAQGQVTAVNPDPTTMNGVCTALYHGTVGTAGCNLPVNLMPPDNPLKANKTYTVAWACGIACGTGNTCPSGMTCDTQSMFCGPQ